MDYYCEDCKEHFETTIFINEEDIEVCPSCGGENISEKDSCR